MTMNKHNMPVESTTPEEKPEVFTCPKCPTQFTSLRDKNDHIAEVHQRGDNVPEPPAFDMNG